MSSNDLSDIAGEYLLVPDQYCMGRVILKHHSKDRFLMFGDWGVIDKISGGDWIAYSRGGRRTVCPGQDNNTNWKICMIDKYVTVTVKCHTHK